MRKLIISLSLILIVCSGIIVYSAIDNSPDIPKPDLSGPTFKVINVVDGDTVYLLIDGKTTSVRLIGVDTPETLDPRKPGEVYGKEATSFTTNMLKGEEVWIDQEPGNTIDKYGRSLYYLYRVPDGLFVNLEIVRQGYGHTYAEYPFRYMELFTYYEQRARDSGKGLWSAPTTAQDSIIKENSKQSSSSDDTTVYITKTGTKYHRDECRYLARSKIPIKKTDAINRGYTPCSVCNP